MLNFQCKYLQNLLQTNSLHFFCLACNLYKQVTKSLSKMCFKVVFIPNLRHFYHSLNIPTTLRPSLYLNKCKLNFNFVRMRLTTCCPSLYLNSLRKCTLCYSPKIYFSIQNGQFETGCTSPCRNLHVQVYLFVHRFSVISLTNM